MAATRAANSGATVSQIKALFGWPKIAGHPFILRVQIAKTCSRIHKKATKRCGIDSKKSIKSKDF
ncbi:hypothetical protein BbINS_03627 [Bartonella bacilliformis INS]|uniref:Uncharacterized protein n=1 Tax=Bartonella bacilliformis INS TaxID=1206782 RepID=A0ABP2SRA3_BARBA|nr:hypothetical protein BbINS_03627 [Bartonella bacilliformis INS]